ncbi:hypothetical protein HUK80_10990 [Flavobacterium sp. MAH-1]|uniref:C1q domain-containing protein n=1 Tax=Flavobacterium agri TaxID=2743471 RepID=A0A7Y9C7H3_9FLAO|nr:hypothetical protein [Flavobacterium agri]NUY81424.1 hypothetical protein [Flavobacterium agri]NYA71448.1 hypothetical protein [Flavobacterium agri]
MKALLLLLILAGSPLCAQIGINTVSPTATLDVNGTMRIRTTSQISRETAAKDSIMVSDSQGNVQRISSKKVVQSHLKSFVKGGFSSSSDQSLSLTSGTVKIPFNQEDFDENDEFDTGTNTFKAKEAGIYAVSVQIKANSAVSVATNFGVNILKNNVVIARSSFANIGITVVVTAINVTPPIRTVQTLVKLNTDDTIRFQVSSDLINVGLLSAKEDSFFTIQQVR